jgi:hypothetical protein
MKNKWIQMLIGFGLGMLLMQEIEVHGVLMGTGVTILFVIVIVIIKKYINSWAEGDFDK